MVVNAMAKGDRERGKTEQEGAGVAILNGMPREGLPVKVSKGEGRDRKSHVGSCMKSIPGREKSTFEEPQGGSVPGKNQARRRGGGRKAKR